MLGTSMVCKNSFLFFCIALLAYKVRERWLFILSFVCFLLWSMQAHMRIVLDGEIGKLMQYSIFFFSGHYAAKYFKWMRKNSLFKWSIMIVWIVALVLHKQTISMLLFNVVLLSMIPICPVKNKIMNYIDKQSYRIYLIHHVVLFALFSLPFLQIFYAYSAIGATIVMFATVMIITISVCYVMTVVKFKYF